MKWRFRSDCVLLLTKAMECYSDGGDMRDAPRLVHNEPRQMVAGWLSSLLNGTVMLVWQ
jgi:hypothetical protein